jgi:DNA-binding HxlR family transcriptional regulator
LKETVPSRNPFDPRADDGSVPVAASGPFDDLNRPAALASPAMSGRDAVRESRVEALAREALMSSPLPSVRTTTVAEGPPRARSTAAPVQSWSPLEATLEVMDDRWKTLIVWRLFWGAKPFCELMRCTRGLSKKTLRHALAEMEKHGLVARQVRFIGSRKAEYALTPYGETLKPIVGAMYEWGLQHGSLPAHGGAPS